MWLHVWTGCIVFSLVCIFRSDVVTTQAADLQRKQRQPTEAILRRRRCPVRPLSSPFTSSVRNTSPSSSAALDGPRVMEETEQHGGLSDGERTNLAEAAEIASHVESHRKASAVLKGGSRWLAGMGKRPEFCWGVDSRFATTCTTTASSRTADRNHPLSFGTREDSANAAQRSAAATRGHPVTICSDSRAAGKNDSSTGSSSLLTGNTSSKSNTTSTSSNSARNITSSCSKSSQFGTAPSLWSCLLASGCREAPAAAEATAMKHDQSTRAWRMGEVWGNGRENRRWMSEGRQPTETAVGRRTVGGNATRLTTHTNRACVGISSSVRHVSTDGAQSAGTPDPQKPLVRPVVSRKYKVSLCSFIQKEDRWVNTQNAESDNHDSQL